MGWLLIIVGFGIYQSGYSVTKWETKKECLKAKRVVKATFHKNLYAHNIKIKCKKLE